MEGIKSIKKHLLTLQKTMLVGRGFDNKIHGQSYWRTTADGRGSVHLAFIDHVQDFDITVDFAVRFDKLEHMKNEFRPWLSDKQKNDTYTMGVELGNFTNGKQMRWTISSDEDVADVVVNIYEAIESYAIPYIEKFSVPDNAFEMMLMDNKEAALHQPIRVERAINAVGLAKLTGKEGILPEIIKSKTEVLKQVNDPELPAFLHFVEQVVRN